MNLLSDHVVQFIYAIEIEEDLVLPESWKNILENFWNQIEALIYSIFKFFIFSEFSQSFLNFLKKS